MLTMKKRTKRSMKLSTSMKKVRVHYSYHISSNSMFGINLFTHIICLYLLISCVFSFQMN